MAVQTVSEPSNNSKRTLKPRLHTNSEDSESYESHRLDEGEKLSSKEADEAIKSLEVIHDLKFFLLTAPVNWHENQVIRRYYLNKKEGFVSCVFWNNLYFITGTDIVRSVAYKLELFGRKIVDRKKLEEGIFSDLRALKCGTSAVLEKPKSRFLKFLYRNQCLRTQKKQKVFFWFSVPHDRLFRDALARDLEREIAGIACTTVPFTKFAKCFHYDHTRDLIPQLRSYILAQTGRDFLYVINDSQEDCGAAATAAAAAGAAAAPSSSNAAIQGDEGHKKEEITDDNEDDVKSQNGSATSTPEFPLDYLRGDPFLFNVDGVGSVAEGCTTQPSSTTSQDFTYAQNPSSAFLPDQPSLWLVSPTGMNISDDLLLDQATPVVPMFNTMNPDPNSGYLAGTPIMATANAPRSMWPTAAGCSVASPGLTMLTGLSPNGYWSKNPTQVAKVGKGQEDKPGTNTKDPTSQYVYTFVPGASSLASSGLSSTGRGSIHPKKLDRSKISEKERIKPQVVTVSPLKMNSIGSHGTENSGRSSGFSAVFSPVVGGKSAEPNFFYYYGASPYYADFPVLPFSRPFSGIKDKFDSSELNTTKNKKKKNSPAGLKKETHKAKGGRIEKPKQKESHILNPSLRHLDLDLGGLKNGSSSAESPNHIKVNEEKGGY